MMKDRENYEFTDFYGPYNIPKEIFCFLTLSRFVIAFLPGTLCFKSVNGKVPFVKFY